MISTVALPALPSFLNKECLKGMNADPALAPTWGIIYLRRLITICN
jgi:hypothetical protein